DRGPAGVRPRRAARRPVAAAHVHRDPAGRLHRDLDQLAGDQHRLLPELRAAARRDHAGHLRPVLAVRVPRAGDRLRPGPEQIAPLPVPALGLVADDQAGRVLLRVLLRAGRRALALLPVHGLHRPVVVTGGPGHRDPGHLVGVHAFPGVLPGLVAAAPRLAGRRGAAGRAGGLGGPGPAGGPGPGL